jgi:putative nucleotidyltransferase with HDIG domain
MATDLTPYAGNWIALIGGQVAGVGHTAVAAELMARRNRPRELITTQFVEPHGGEPLALSPLLEHLRPILAQLDIPVYLVGGAVRDAVMGRISHDLDFAVPHDAIQTAFRVGNALGVPAYVLDKVRDTGRVMFAETTLDFARFRGADLTADLQDRDFTINAIALPAAAQTSSSLMDPTGGLADIAARQIRLTHETALQDDPIRALRAVRQSLSFDFALAEETAVAITNAAPLLHTTSNERIRDEVLKLLATAVPHKALAHMQELGLLAEVLPEMAALADVAQSPPHHERVLAHTVSVLRWLAEVETAVFHGTTDPILAPIEAKLSDYAPQLHELWGRLVYGGVDGRSLLYWGALLHDVGKGETQAMDENGRIRFFGHDKVGAAIAGRRLRRLALSNEAITHVKGIVAGHMRPLLLTEAQGARPSRRAVYRFYREIKSAGLDVCLLALADHLATYDGLGDEAQWQQLTSLVAALLEHYFTRHEESVAPPLLLDGRQLIDALHLSPGPEIGRLLRLLEEAQAAGEVNSVDEALIFVRRSRQ